MNDNKKIVGVAIKQGDKVHSLPKPKRHSDVVIKMVKAGHYRMVEEQQGFVCGDSSFLNRTDAGVLALQTGQVRKLISPPQLSSIDLW